MIFSDKKILQSIEENKIVIEPFDRECLGTNSYDVHLGEWLAVYDDDVLDAKNTIPSLISKFRKMVMCYNLGNYI